ncbi:MAG: hypothetical protein M3R24_25255 [Chloroflexota bacterium]|nr:hypothetical protein [Chloroflexota bacterium]
MTENNRPDVLDSIPPECTSSSTEIDHVSPAISVPTILLPCLSLLAVNFWDHLFDLGARADGPDRVGGGSGWAGTFYQ